MSHARKVKAVKGLQARGRCFWYGAEGKCGHINTLLGLTASLVATKFTTVVVHFFFKARIGPKVRFGLSLMTSFGWTSAVNA